MSVMSSLQGTTSTYLNSKGNTNGKYLIDLFVYFDFFQLIVFSAYL